MATSSKKPSASSKVRKKKSDDVAAEAMVEKTKQPPSLTVVGIGASAGGLAALNAFFDALPNETGMAFVVVIHLHPEYESHLAELLQKHTQMPTVQVTKKIKVEPNHVYVIPPNRSIVMADAHIETAEFVEPHGQRTPIDHFLRSLAQGHGEALAVILSGGGTDGSVGIKAIKEQGGVILVQQPDEAEYDSMPRAAINTGLADVVLPASQLAAKLMEYTQHRSQLPHDPNQLTEQELAALQRILAQVHARTGHDFNQYKRSTILRRVERRMQLNGLRTLEAYLIYLRQHDTEAQAMFNDILIGVTTFFRDHEAWQAVEEKVLPALFNQKDESDEIRVWSIGCSTGEEAYSLAILLFEQAAKLDYRPFIQIFASDLDEAAIVRARNGVYPSAIAADVSPERLERFFTHEGEYYRVKRELRDAVLFSNHNLLRDPPFTRQSLIVCRNVLIYLQRSIQEHVFDIFHYALKPESYLFLGNSESAEYMPELFEVVDKSHRLYRARPWSGERPHIPSLPLTMKRGSRTTEAPAVTHRLAAQFPEESTTIEKHHQLALEMYSPPSMLINDHYQILHISETAGRYLYQPKGPISNELLKVVRPELQLELRTALFQAFEKGQATISQAIVVQFNGHAGRVVVVVRLHHETLEPAQGTGNQALVFFLEDESEAQPEASALALSPNQLESHKLITQLETEVQRLREQLQITGEEYESSNEEMKATNEELQSINEEYRSTTEELETSKEELQSVNEELQTVNNEMRSKLDEISKAQQELENLMGANEIPTLFLDRKLHIQRYSAGIKELFSILKIDVGRSIGDLTHKLGYNEFSEDAEQVLHSLVPLEREIQVEDGRSFVIRLRPYRTVDNHIEGVVITFIDITKLKKIEHELNHTRQTLENDAQERTRELQERTRELQERTRELQERTRELDEARFQFENLFTSNALPTSITDLDTGVFIQVSAAYLKYFNLQEEQVLGRKASELNLPIAPSLRTPLITRLRNEGSIQNIEMEVKLASGEIRTLLASLQIVQMENKDALMQTFMDITERVRAERDLRTAATSLNSAEQLERRRISQILHDDLQQQIFAVKVQLSFLAEALENNNAEAARADLQQIDEWLAEAIAKTRQLSVDISPPILSEEGLVESLLWLAAQAKSQYNLDVTVEAAAFYGTLEDDVRTLALQAIRELLFNVVKHAEAAKATITVERLNHEVNITVSDEGQGFDPQIVQGQQSHGLKRMRDRLLLVGCNLQIDSGVNHGTRITIVAPAANQTT